MDRRRFGRTGIEIAAFTLGGGAVGGILVRGPEETRAEAIRRYLAAGGNWIDTAASYGDGESERTLGRLLPSMPSRPYLSTKFQVDTGRLDALEDQIRRSLDASLERLQLDRVELYQLHNPIAARGAGHTLALDDALRVADVLDRLREEGLFRWHGITALGETPAVNAAVRSGRFDTAQIYHNLLNPTAAGHAPEGWVGQDFTGLLDACAAMDVGTMNIRVLAAGVLATDQRHGREGMITSGTDLGQEEQAAARLLARLGDRHGSRASAAIRFALAEPALSTILVGIATLEQLDEAIAAFAAGPLPADAIAALGGRPRA